MQSPLTITHLASTYLFIYLSVYLSIHPYIYLSIYLSTVLTKLPLHICLDGPQVEHRQL
jgi:hypothetical protein